MSDTMSEEPLLNGISQQEPTVTEETSVGQGIQTNNKNMPMFRQAVMNAIVRKNIADRSANRYKPRSDEQKLKADRDIKSVLSEIANMPNLSSYTVSNSFGDAFRSMTGKSSNVQTPPSEAATQEEVQKKPWYKIWGGKRSKKNKKTKKSRKSRKSKK